MVSIRWREQQFLQHVQLLESRPSGVSWSEIKMREHLTTDLSRINAFSPFFGALQGNKSMLWTDVWYLITQWSFETANPMAAYWNKMRKTQCSSTMLKLYTSMHNAKAWQKITFFDFKTSKLRKRKPFSHNTGTDNTEVKIQLG